jgi:hypothetical protein
VYSCYHIVLGVHFQTFFNMEVDGELRGRNVGGSEIVIIEKI